MRNRPALGILLTSTVMVIFGLVMVLSASSVEAYKLYGSSFKFFNRQVFGVMVGFSVMAVLARMDYRLVRHLARPMLGITFVLLIAVLLPGLGVTRGGSSRWLNLGPVSVQPSEMAKLVLIIFAAHVLEKKGRKVLDVKEMAIPVLPATALICLLVIAQPDLGTTIIVASSAFAVLFLSGVRARHVAAMASAGLLAVAALAMTEGYRRQRIFGFLDPWADPLNTGYQNIQGQIALGSGGWFGVGLGASRQKWSYVPNAHTDFIYSIIGEELGVLGTVAVLFLFVWFIYLGVRVAQRAPDRFGFLMAGGITGWIGIQAIVNMGAVSGMLPITGVPLPMISFGGSSLVFTMAAIGMLISIASRGEARAKADTSKTPATERSRQPIPTSS